MTAATRTSPADWLADLLDATGAARSGKKWQCPVHGTTGEHSVAVAVGMRTDGKRGAWIYCHAGCELDALLAALRLTRPDLISPPPVSPVRHARAWRLIREYPPPKSAGAPAERGFRFEAEHPYGDPQPIAWKIRLRHPTSRAKEITWESLNPRGERVPGLLGRRQVDLPLYCSRDVRMAVGAGEIVLVCESESSVDALIRAGWYATCWPGGAGDPPLDQLRAVLGDHGPTVLIPDNDDAGLACRDRIVASGAITRVLLGSPGEDARDLLARLGADRFRAEVERALARPAPAAPVVRHPTPDGPEAPKPPPPRRTR